MITETQPRRASSAKTWGCLAGSVVALIGGGLILVVLAVLSIAGWAWISAVQTNTGSHAFENRLSIPPLLDHEIDNNGRKIFNLAFMSGMSEMIPGHRFESWGLNGDYLAPTIRAKRDDEVVVNVRNDLDETTTLHWHGMHLPARMDGGPHQMIEPGETWSPEWTIDQPAATLWFHPHLHGRTAEHVYRGAAGMFIIDDPEIEELPLPKEYGVDDIPLIIQDRQVSDGRFVDQITRFMRQNGTLGDEILVNGTHAPLFEAETSLVRFRLLNASVARIYNLGFDDDREFSIIATDSGLIDQPVAMKRIQLSPGERAEIVVELAQGDDVMFRSSVAELNVEFWTQRLEGGDDLFDIVRIRAADNLSESPQLPSRLTQIDRLRESDAVRTRSFDLEDSTSINGQSMDMNRIDEVVEVDTTEIWEITNASGHIHNFHIHLVHFQILDIDGEAPPAHLHGWKDTVFIPRGSTIRLIAEFRDYADSEYPYMYHCHILRHEDSGMMGQFVVIEPGMDVPVRIETNTDHRH
jgi:FtsP/CotA-like multicopper oxidase with cupredoxin domain